MLHGEELRRIRLSRGLSQKDIADYSKINKRVVGGIERGDMDLTEELEKRYLTACYNLEPKN